MTQAQVLGTDPSTAMCSADWDGLLSRVGLELRTLAATVNNLQQFLLPLVGPVVERDAVAITRLQDFDLVEQSLHGLSDLMSCLDTSITLTDAGALAAGVKTLRLTDLAQRLSATAPAAERARHDASALEIF